MFSVNRINRSIAASAISLLLAGTTYAAVSTADSVLQYVGGADFATKGYSYWGAPYDQTSAVLGLPQAAIDLDEDDDQGIYADHSFVTPFNPQYLPTQIVAISGAGGYIEVHMSQPVSTAGFTLGVHAGVGLNDSSYPDGINYDPANTYTDLRSATVMVSDGTTWKSLGLIDFNNPTNIYTDITSPFPDSPGTQLANFAQPFLGNLSSFDGTNFAGTLSALDGSAGGTWLDLSGTGLTQVTDVAFETGSDQTMILDSVVGIPIPEPTSLVVLFIPVLLGRRR